MKAFLASALFAALTSTTASAALLVDNGLPDFEEPNSRGITIFRSADDFILMDPVEVTSIRFWMVAEPGQFTGSITYAFYEDSSGSLGSVVSSDTVSGIVPLLVDPIDGNIHSMYQVDFNRPVALALDAGTYWLELHDGPDLTGEHSDNVLWAIVAGIGGTGNAKQNPIPALPNTDTNNELAFQLYGDVVNPSTDVPEPATFVLSAAGLGALVLLRRRAF